MLLGLKAIRLTTAWLHDYYCLLQRGYPDLKTGHILQGFCLVTALEGVTLLATSEVNNVRSTRSKRGIYTCNHTWDR